MQGCFAHVLVEAMAQVILEFQIVFEFLICEALVAHRIEISSSEECEAFSHCFCVIDGWKVIFLLGTKVFAPPTRSWEATKPYVRKASV